MKCDWEKIKKFDQEGLLPLVLPNYVADKLIFRVCVWLIFAWTLFVFQSQGWDFSANYYLECPSTGGVCANPYYNVDGLSEPFNYAESMFSSKPVPCPQEGLCNQEFIQAGESIGKKPSWMLTYGLYVDLLFLLSAVFLNHFLYNKGYFKARFKDLKESE